MKPGFDPDDLSQLPDQPDPGYFLTAYQLCRQKLIKANRSRGALMGHDKRRHALLQDLQAQLTDLEQNLRGEMESKVSLHDLNLQIAEILQGMENELDQASSIVDEPGHGGLTSWTVRIASLIKQLLGLRKLKSRLKALLSRDEPAPSVEVLEEVAPPSAAALPLTPSEPPAVQPPTEPVLAPGLLWPDGALLLIDQGHAFGLIAVHPSTQPVPSGFSLDLESPWLSGAYVLVPEGSDDPDFAPFDAAMVVLVREVAVLPWLQTWRNLGLLPFIRDPDHQLLRLIPPDQLDAATHVLVQEQKAAAFLEAGTDALALDLDDEDWLGFGLSTTDDVDLLRRLVRQRREPSPLPPRLSTRGGVRMAQGQGFLATGLGLPLLGVPSSVDVEGVTLILADGESLAYAPIAAPETETEQEGTEQNETSFRRLWQPPPQIRRRRLLASGPARFLARLNGGSQLERAVQLTSLPARLRFQRSYPLAFREDWGLLLGPLRLPPEAEPRQTPTDEALARAEQRLSLGDLTVNPIFEQQMLESLAALFQRRPSIQRRDFLLLYQELRNRTNDWQRFPEAVLRGWCEGGWIEEGLERSTGRWRLQPVDPRLVRLESGGFQLVGLLSGRGLLEVLAIADELGTRIEAVPPACADMPRGWRFHGNGDTLAAATGLPLVEQSAWVPDPAEHQDLWVINQPLESDSPPWPTGLNTLETRDAVCGRRPCHHWTPRRLFPEQGRAPVSLTITAETSTYGKRRWLSNDPVSQSRFYSCHRNRVALHALIVATDGLWPFGFTGNGSGQLDRMYDADAYLPLPISRFLALTGSKMPGPTRYRPEDHTYRYHAGLTLRSQQRKTRFLPLTPMP